MFNFLIGYFCMCGIISTVYLLKLLLESQNWYRESEMGPWFDAILALVGILVVMLILYGVGSILI